jgi:hypothetical protein
VSGYTVYRDEGAGGTPQPLPFGQLAVQTLRLDNAVGTLSLAFQGAEVAVPVDFSAQTPSAAALETALESIPVVGTVNVARSALGGGVFEHAVTLFTLHGDIEALALDPSGLTASAPPSMVQTVRGAGDAPVQTVETQCGGGAAVTGGSFLLELVDDRLRSSSAGTNGIQAVAIATAPVAFNADEPTLKAVLEAALAPHVPGAAVAVERRATATGFVWTVAFTAGVLPGGRFAPAPLMGARAAGRA